jgi:hypothetical protein
MARITPMVRTERRRQIIDAAWRCTARRGFSDLTVDEVCAEAALARGPFTAISRASGRCCLRCWRMTPPAWMRSWTSSGDACRRRGTVAAVHPGRAGAGRRSGQAAGAGGPVGSDADGESGQSPILGQCPAPPRGAAGMDRCGRCRPASWPTSRPTPLPRFCSRCATDSLCMRGSSCRIPVAEHSQGVGCASRRDRAPVNNVRHTGVWWPRDLSPRLRCALQVVTPGR